MHRITLRTLLGAAVLTMALGFAASGCKGKSGSGDKAAKKKGRVGSCDRIKIDSLCVQYSEDNFIAGEDHLKQFCDIGKGAFKLEPCPEDKRIGRCVTAEGTNVYYSSGTTKRSADKLSKSCTEGIHKGKWVPAK